MSLGQYRVGIDFNPDGNKEVNTIKTAAASWIDYLENFSQRDGLAPEAIELVRIAQRGIEDAAMWSVKAVTKKPRS